LQSPRIFVSYRRGSSGGWSGRLVDDLAKRFGKDRVFQDVLSIRPGVDFVKALSETLQQADCVLAVIEPEWLSVKDETGGRRLDDEDDYVRLELATALRTGSRVIPVLFGGAKMPAPALLPEDVRKLARLNAAEVSDSRWSYDLDRLAQEIAGSSRQWTSRVVLTLGLLSVVLVGAFGLVWWSPKWLWPNPIKPAYNLSGTYVPQYGDGQLNISQSGDDLSWTYDNAALSHNFLGKYISPTKAIGIQTRTDRQSGCRVQMDVEVTAWSNHNFCLQARLNPGSDYCDLSTNWSDAICYH
jgi:nitrate reductase NapE component